MASVNFPVAAQLREEMFRVGGAVVNHLPDWKTTCYAIEPEDTASDGVSVVEVAWALLELLQSQGIPHNVVIVGLVVFIFPRQPQCENGIGLFTDSASDSDTTTAPVGRLRIAVAELSGLVIAGDNVAYANLTEELFNMILEKEVSLSAVSVPYPTHRMDTVLTQPLAWNDLHQRGEAALIASWKYKIDIKTM